MAMLPTGWIKVADNPESIEFNEKNIALLSIDGYKFCIIKTADGLKACTDKCPHAGASLSNGYIDRKKNIVCCEHNYKFSLQTGRDAFNEGYFLKIFDVAVRPDGVFINM